MGSLFGREPAAVIAAIEAIIAVAVGFGLDLSPEQFALIMAGMVAVFGLITRSQVTPVSQLDQDSV